MFIYHGVTSEQIADAYKEYAELLIEKNIGPEITILAEKILASDGLIVDMAN